MDSQQDFFFEQLAAILPLAVVHTLGNLFTNMSLGMVAVSFTHTIKAMEPFFSVILSALFLGEVRMAQASGCSNSWIERSRRDALFLFL